MYSHNYSVTKIVEVIKSMKPREQQKCIKNIIHVLSNSTLNKSAIVEKWFRENEFLCQEKYII